MRDKPRLLIVDDDADIAREIGLFLGQTFEVAHASSIDEAKSMLHREPGPKGHGVVVADMRLVGDSRGGLRLAQDIAELKDRPEIVVLTAHPDFADASECMKAGVFGYVEKGKEDTYEKLERECLRAYRLWRIKQIEVPDVPTTEVTSKGDSKSETIFISYSRKDARWKDEFVKHLSPLKRRYDLRTWSDTEIPLSADWRQSIRQAMDQATISVLLVSSNFLDSEFCMDVELKEFVQARVDRGLKLVAILVSDCYWQEVPIIERYLVLPRGGTPIKSRPSRQREAIWVAIVREIAQLLSV